MKQRDVIELALIAVATGAAAALSPRLPRALAAGEIVLIVCGLLLAQGLIRDLWIKYGPGKNSSCALAPVPAGVGAASITGADAQASGAAKAPIAGGATCMCAESTIGTVGIFAGVVALAFGGFQRPLHLPTWLWPVLVGGTGISGFLLKSLVIDWKTRKLRFVTDHSTIRFGRSVAPSDSTIS